VVCVMCCFGTVTVFTVVTEVVAGCLTTVDVVVDVSTGAGLGGAGTTFWVAITPSFFLEATSFLTDLDVLLWAPLLRRLSRRRSFAHVWETIQSEKVRKATILILFLF